MGIDLCKGLDEGDGKLKNVLDNKWIGGRIVYEWMEMVARSTLAHTLRGDGEKMDFGF